MRIEIATGGVTINDSHIILKSHRFTMYTTTMKQTPGQIHSIRKTPNSRRLGY
jgi:hypothetical protein